MNTGPVDGLCDSDLIHSLVVLLVLRANIDYLKDVVVGAQFQGSHVDLDVVFQKVLCQLANLLGPGSAPHQRLSVRLGAVRAARRKTNRNKYNF